MAFGCGVTNTSYIIKMCLLSGLSLILYTENDEYLSGISQGYGMRLLIHEQGTFPMPNDEGILISSSFETSIGLRLVRRTINFVYVDIGDNKT
jgi:hypothetical protein